MNERIKVAAVSYLNTKPFLFGLEKSSNQGLFEVQTFTPSICFEKLRDGSFDIGLIPVATIPEINNPQIITDYCIGSVGKVGSVLLLSQQPIEKVNKVYLDYQSRTSIILAQILFKHHWKLNPEFIPASTGYESLITDFKAGVVIGDRALNLKTKFEYAYDLSEEWYKMTHLPFVFACWVANKKIETNALRVFNEALKSGVEHIDALIESLKKEKDYFQGTPFYLKQNISYPFDELKKQGLNKFIELVKNQ